MKFSPLRRSDPDFFEFQWLDVLSAQWQDGRNYTSTTIVRPGAPMGFYAECTTAGQSGGREPRWKAEDGALIRDGSIVWTMRHPSAVTLPTISVHSYAITPSGIVQTSPTIAGAVTSVKLDASAASLGTYNVVAEITAGGEDYSLETDLEVID